MPALPSPGKVIRVHLRWGPSDTNQWGSRFYITYSGGPPNSADMATFASNVFGFCGGNIMPLVESNIFLTETTVVDLNTDTGAEGSHTGSTAGGDGSGLVPEDVCALINHVIPRRYRGGKPKIFLPPGGLGALADDKSWTNTFTGNMTAAWEAFVAATLADAFASFTPVNIVNVSFYKGFTPFAEPSGRYRNIPTARATPLVDPISSSSCRGEIGSQRRRRTAITG
jgi:hypothetical protein